MDDEVEQQVYEVFRREKEGAAMQHAGTVTAPTPQLALLYAREVYGRRGESVELWVAPRACFHALDDGDILRPPLNRAYRLVEGYRMRDKLAAVKDKLGER